MTSVGRGTAIRSSCPGRRRRCRIDLPPCSRTKYRGGTPPPHRGDRPPEVRVFTDRDQFLRYLTDEDVSFVDVRFCDLLGIMQHFTVPAESFDEDLFDNGVAFDGSSIRGFQEIHESDMLLLPDASTAFVDP